MFKVWRNFVAKWQALVGDRRGNVAMIFGLSVIPILIAAGVAVDYSRALIVRQRLSSALDAAALAVGRSTGLSQAQMDTLAQSYFDANYPDSALGTPTPVTTSLNGDVVTVRGTAVVATAIMRIVGFDNMTVNVESQVTKETTGLDLVLVLDTTGSMGQNNKLDTLKTAATDLVNTLFGDSDYPEFLKIGIVPFSVGVRLDTSTLDTSWIDTAGDSAVAQQHFSGGKSAYWLYTNSGGMTDTTWRGCVEARGLGADGHTLDETDTPPTSAETRWAAYFQPDEPHVGEAENTHGNPDWDPASADQPTVSSNYSDDYIQEQMTVGNQTISFNAIDAFSVLTITDSAKTGDTLTTNVNHGLSTGQGPIRVAGSSLPAPLSSSTNYWVIKSSNNKIKLATSYANAIAGTAVDLTASNGTGYTNVLNTQHYMSTGDGPIQVRSSGTLPSGLSAGTNYYLISLGSSRFELATSAANATAGTGIAITSAGSGTHQINAVYSTSHGLVTGGGPYTVSGGSLPGGLSTGTNYWVKRVNGDVFQLATSQANATASPPTVVTLTSVGGSSNLVIPGIDVANDTLMATSSHGFTTGDGPIRIMSTGTLPGGISGTTETTGQHGSTDYWVIVVDSTKIKLATSQAYALAGSPVVDITSIGTGTVYTTESPGGTTLTEQRARQKEWRKYAGHTWSGTSGPNSGCDMQPITPLTNDKALILSKIQALNASGNTHIPLGLGWGWRVISPDPPFTEGVPYSNDSYVKAIVLMTDGDNTMPSQSSTLNASQYTEYGYATDQRLGSGINTASGMQTEMDNSLTRICNNIKAVHDSAGDQRIKIFTIGVQISTQSTLDLLSNCATVPTEADEQYYFNATDNAALTSAFHQIATQLSNLRVSH